MIIALIVLALIFAHITYRDVKSRLVYRRDLFALIIARAVLFVVVLVGEEVFGLSSVLGLSNEQWGLAPLIVSVALAVITCVIVQSVAFITNRLTNKYGEKEESLGLGDVWLYAACCLFFNSRNVVCICFPISSNRGSNGAVLQGDKEAAHVSICACHCMVLFCNGLRSCCRVDLATEPKRYFVSWL